MVWDPHAPALDRGRVAEVAARVIEEAEPNGLMSPFIREGALDAACVTGPYIPPAKTERLQLLTQALQAWDGPDSAKSTILKAFVDDDFLLYLDRCNLTSLPRGLHLLTHMGNLSVENNPLLQRLPDQLAFAPKLTRLDVAGCDLHALPANLSQARGLVVLDVAGNKNLRSLPDSMDRLEKLQTVNLKNCDLSRLPEGGFGPSLRELDLCDNKRLGQLPSEIGKSQNLELILLRNCALRQIPSAIGNLPKLRALDMAGNTQIVELPPGIDFKKVYVGTRETQVRLMELILSLPIASDIRTRNEKELKALQKKWQGLQKKMAKGGAETAQRAQAAREEVDGLRAGLSNTVQSTSRAGMNWNAAANQVQRWASEGDPLDTEHLKKLNAMLGRDLQPFNDPQAVENFGARFGEFRRQLTGFVQDHAWCGVVDEREIGVEMAHFDEWFESKADQVAQGTVTPVELAAATAQRLISIHPFPDANGRTARLAADWVLASYGLPPSACDDRQTTVYSSGNNRKGPEDALNWMTRGLAKTIDIYEQHLKGSSSWW
ncbi:Fic family protein [Xylophilus ampelinus]|uniref:Leucine rich repeat (LRR) protein n=1 Tax=Xylophilus ampelinus TaxID=54067 RepID=A0A318SU33_9BURK|nr:Fic family protein [Xylophilus ampelinus]MCS4510213.1 Fic family protein [Xylophilus ampelinus]PYE78167.1 leucine rich repeat (LRR) protein [Xylophilus ampelinus]